MADLEVRFDIEGDNLSLLLNKMVQISLQNPEFRKVKIITNETNGNKSGVSEATLTEILDVSVKKADVRKVLYRLDELNILKYFAKGKKEFVKGRRAP